LLALLGFVGWLGASGRLDRSRIDQTTGIYSITVAQEKAAQEQLEKEAAAAEAGISAVTREVKSDGPPLTAEQILEVKLEQSEADLARIRRLRKEGEDLKYSLVQERRTLDEAREAFMAERTAFDDRRSKIRDFEGQAQFKKAVGVLEAMKADEARDALQAYLDAGNTDQAVSYLNAMEGRVLGKVMRSFTKQDPVVAADLLDRLRTHGLKAGGFEGNSE